jgi:hypothetical protein
MCQLQQYLGLCARSCSGLETDLVVSNADGTSAEAIGPEALNRWGAVSAVRIKYQIGDKVNLRARHAVMGEEEPEAKDWLGKDIENSVGNDLSVETNDTCTIGNSPDAVRVLVKIGTGSRR